MGYNYDSISKFLIYSFILGFALGFVYDFFRAIRLSFSQGKGRCPLFLTCICDILFFVCSGVVCCIFIFATNNGRARGIALFVSLLGFIVYLNSLGKLTVRVYRFLFDILKRLYNFVFAVIIGNILLLFYKILRKTGLALKKFYDYLFTRREMFRIIKAVRKI